MFVARVNIDRDGQFASNAGHVRKPLGRRRLSLKKFAASRRELAKGIDRRSTTGQNRTGRSVAYNDVRRALLRALQIELPRFTDEVVTKTVVRLLLEEAVACGCIDVPRRH
jgi:hypothetical protein